MVQINHGSGYRCFGLQILACYRKCINCHEIAA